LYLAVFLVTKFFSFIKIRYAIAYSKQKTHQTNLFLNENKPFMKKFHVANLFLPRQSQRRGTKRCGAFNDGAAKLPR
jgi:hypothetical protein